MSEEKKLEGYELTEEELLETLNFLEQKRKLLKHPESPDNVAVLHLEEHILRRLNEISWKRYREEKSIKITRV